MVFLAHHPETVELVLNVTVFGEYVFELHQVDHGLEFGGLLLVGGRQDRHHNGRLHETLRSLIPVPVCFSLDLEIQIQQQH